MMAFIMLSKGLAYCKVLLSKVQKQRTKYGKNYEKYLKIFQT